MSIKSPTPKKKKLAVLKIGLRCSPKRERNKKKPMATAPMATPYKVGRSNLFIIVFFLSWRYARHQIQIYRSQWCPTSPFHSIFAPIPSGGRMGHVLCTLRGGEVSACRVAKGIRNRVKKNWDKALPGIMVPIIFMPFATSPSAIGIRNRFLNIEWSVPFEGLCPGHECL